MSDRQIRIVETRHHTAVKRHLVGEVDERLLQVGEAAVVFEMFVVDVRDHSQCWKQFQKRSIAFVCLGDHDVPASEPRVAAERAQPPADHRGRVEPGALEHQRDHRRGRRLAVGAGDRDAVAEPHQLGKHLRARDHRDLPSRRLADLGIGRPHRRGDHDDVRVADVRRVVPVGDLDPQRRQSLGHRRPLLVRSADHVSEIGEQLGDSAHADAADPDKMHTPRGA
jgi:hypothetical protein